MKLTHTLLAVNAALAASSSAETTASSTTASSTAAAAGGAATGSVALFILVVVVMAVLLLKVLVPYLKKEDPSILRSFAAAPQSGQLGRVQNWMLNKVDTQDGTTVICGGTYVFEQLDDDGYTIMSQPLAIGAVQGEDYIVIIPPKGYEDPFFDEGNIVQTVRLKNSSNILTVPHSSPLAIFQQSDGQLVLMANAENRNPTTLANGKPIDKMPLSQLDGKVFYCGDQAMILHRVNQNKSQQRAVTYKGQKRSQADESRSQSPEPAAVRRNVRG